jgi:hypothetical protein
MTNSEIEDLAVRFWSGLLTMAFGWFVKKVARPKPLDTGIQRVIAVGGQWSPPYCRQDELRPGKMFEY